jgi:hypothetical protein
MNHLFNNYLKIGIIKMKGQKFDKNDLIFYFQNYEFPKEKINKDVLVHSELLFNKDSKSAEPEVASSKKKVKLSSCFIIEDELEPGRKGGAFNKKGNFPIGNKNNRPFNNSNNRNNSSNNQWRVEEDPSTTDFFDTFKGKSDESKVTQFKRNKELSLTRENSISINGNNFNDHTGGKVHIIPIATEEETLSNQALSADNFFDNADKILNTLSISNAKKESPKENIKYDPNPSIVEMKLLYKINELLHYPNEECLWYIFHPVAKSAFGPLSSPNIEEMYKSKMVTGQTEIRLIDIYNLKGRKPFEFFKLKDIERSGFLDEIEISALLKVAVGMNSKNNKN